MHKIEWRSLYLFIQQQEIVNLYKKLCVLIITETQFAIQIEVTW